MNRVLCFFTTTVGRKMLVGLSGLAWAGFVLTHMAGNLLLLKGAEAYNRYSHAIITNPALPLAELGLVVFLALHVTLALALTVRNRAARGSSYKKGTCGPKRTRFASKTMAITGTTILVFIVLHLITFKYGTHYMVTYDGIEMRDLYQLVVEKFKDPLYVSWYVIAMGVLSVHLSHAFSASFQSLGVFASNDKALRRASLAFAAVVSIGFTVQPLFLFFYGQ